MSSFYHSKFCCINSAGFKICASFTCRSVDSHVLIYRCYYVQVTNLSLSFLCAHTRHTSKWGPASSSAPCPGPQARRAARSAALFHADDLHCEGQTAMGVGVHLCPPQGGRMSGDSYRWERIRSGGDTFEVQARIGGDGGPGTPAHKERAARGRDFVFRAS